MIRWRAVAISALVLVLLTGWGVFQSAGNPIPVPTLLMPEEYIDALVYAQGGRLFALVEGVYPFANVEVEEAKMYYPLPPDAAGIRVWLDGEELSWGYVTCRCEFSTTYPTAVGDYRMIRWDVDPVPDEFEIKVRYKHELPQLDGKYVFLYAMGTGRFLEYYAKQTTAHVNVRMELNYGDLEVLTDGTPTDCELDQVPGQTAIRLTETSGMFQPLAEDLLIKFNRVLSIPEAIDADWDGRICEEEMLQAIRYWINDQAVPGTGGQTINDLTLHQLAEFWVIGQPYVLTPYGARARAIDSLLAQNPDSGLPREAIWDPQRITPEGLVGYETIRYTHGSWQIEVGYPVVPFPDYDVTVTNSQTGFTWSGKVTATGIIS